MIKLEFQRIYSHANLDNLIRELDGLKRAEQMLVSRSHCNIDLLRSYDDEECSGGMTDW